MKEKFSCGESPWLEVVRRIYWQHSVVLSDNYDAFVALNRFIGSKKIRSVPFLNGSEMKTHNSDYRKDGLSSQVIYPYAKNRRYVVFLCATKLLRAVSIFLAYDALKQIHVVQFLFITKVIAVVPFFLLQKPLSSGKPIVKQQWMRIARHALFSSAITLLWLFGLTQCGPLRTILLCEHADVVVIAAMGALFMGVGSHSKFRGVMCFCIGVITLLLFDNDDQTAIIQEHPEGSQHRGISHIYYKIVYWMGLADHKVGVLLLIATLLLQTGFNAAARRLSVDIGGSKRLHSLSTLLSVAILAPWAFIIRMFQQVNVDWLSLLMPCIAVSFLLFVVDYYIESICISHLEAEKTSSIGSSAIFISAAAFSIFWSHSSSNNEESSPEHVLSVGVIFSLIMFLLANFILSSHSSKSAKGTFIGYSESGLPLYSFGSGQLHKTSHSIVVFSKSLIKKIMEENDSRKIFYFLCVNFAFTFVEVTYGIWTNSLGLLSDGFHMLFDCSALVMGLCASLMSRWKATRMISYGYGRVEVLSGFINGLFLVVISFFVFTEALSRLFDPPKIMTDKLLPVSVIGLLVNLFGILVFRNSHSHGHSHHNHHHGHSHNSNMEGVFLHVLADTMGSIGVIVSTLLIQHFGLYIADPICSVFIACLIFLSVLPLLKQASCILLLKSPDNEKAIEQALAQVLNIKGVISYRNQHFWQHIAAFAIGTIQVQVMPDVQEHTIIQQVTTIFKNAGINDATIQVEKEECYQHLSALSSSLSSVFNASEQAAKLSMHHKVSTAIKAI